MWRPWHRQNLLGNGSAPVRPAVLSALPFPRLAGLAFLHGLCCLLAGSFRLAQAIQDGIGGLTIGAGQTLAADGIEVAPGQSIAAVLQLDDSDAGMVQGCLGGFGLHVRKMGGVAVVKPCHVAEQVLLVIFGDALDLRDLKRRQNQLVGGLGHGPFPRKLGLGLAQYRLRGLHLAAQGAGSLGQMGGEMRQTL